LGRVSSGDISAPFLAKDQEKDWDIGVFGHRRREKSHEGFSRKDYKGSVRYKKKKHSNAGSKIRKLRSKGRENA